MSKLDYYYFPTSHWSRIVSLAIAEKQLSPQPHMVDIRVNATFDPAYLQLNPRGVVPTLVVDGEAIWNGPTIMRRLDAMAEPRLVRDEDPEASTWFERLEDFPVMLFSYSVWILGNKGERSAEILADKIARARRGAEEHPEFEELYTRKGDFFERFSRELHDPGHLRSQEETYRGVLDEMGALVKDREFLCGEYSAADCVATSILFRLVDLGRLDEWHEDSSHGLHAYYQRLRARPSFARVFVDDPLIPANYRP